MLSVPARHARRVVPMLMMAFTLVGAGQEPADADAALRRTRERLLADLERMPRYTCVQTITRQYYVRKAKATSCSALMADHGKNSDRLKFHGWDRLRLEVAIVDGNNVYSWVGAPRFEGDTMGQLAGSGPLSSGDFGPYLYLLFKSAVISFKGEDLTGKRRLLAYSYDVPLDRSSYKVRSKQGWAVTAYSGTFLLDPVNADIVSLTVQTAELPEGNPDCQYITEVDYGRTQIHDRVVLIPRQTSLETIGRDGGEVHSLTTYASCREYASQSRILAESTAAPAATSAPPLLAPMPLAPMPPGLHFRARIITPIDSDTSSAGDPIEAVLLSSIRSKGREWAAAGARLHGRLLSLAQSMSPSLFQVLVQFESIELTSRTVPFRAAPDPSGLSEICTTDGCDNVFIFRKEHLHLEKLEWGWTTLTPLTTLPEPESQPRTFAAGAHFRARIVTPIDSDAAVAGDPIEAVLLSPIPGKDGQESAPTGAHLYGHLLGLKQYQLESHDYVEVLARFESIEVNGSAKPLQAAPYLDPFGDNPYGMLVIRDNAIKENLFLFSVKHLHLENFDWNWTTLPAQQSPPQSPTATFPAGAHFRARIVTPIDSDIDSNAAAPGDPIEAVLLSPIPDKDGREWAPAGARLHGRLLGLRQKQLNTRSVVEVVMQFESIELNGSEVPLQAAPDVGLNTGAGTYQPAVSVFPDEALRMNLFIFREQHLHLENFDWSWTTLLDHESQPSTFPGGLHFRARVVTPIDPDTTVAGDPIQAVLLSPIGGKDGREAAPVGVRLYGHLLALKQYQLESHDYVEVLVRFEFIELDGSAVPLRAAPYLDPFGDNPYGMLVIRDNEIKENFFLFSMKHLHLENFDWDWRTLPKQLGPSKSPPRTFPAGAHFRARIVTPIDSDIDSNTAAPGDPIEAVLLSPISRKDGREWAPAGARLHGRLLGLRQKQLNTRSVVEVVMQFESIELNGSEVPLQAAPDLTDLSIFSTAGVNLLPEVFVAADDAIRMNVFIFHKKTLHLENLDWDWTTIPAQQSPP